MLLNIYCRTEEALLRTRRLFKLGAAVGPKQGFFCSTKALPSIFFCRYLIVHKASKGKYA